MPRQLFVGRRLPQRPRQPRKDRAIKPQSATVKKEKNGKDIYKREPVYASENPKGEGRKVWSLKSGKNAKDYKSALAVLNAKRDADGKFDYSKARKILDAEYYEIV